MKSIVMNGVRSGRGDKVENVVMNGVNIGKLENCKIEEEMWSQSEERFVQVNHKSPRETQS